MYKQTLFQHIKWKPLVPILILLIALLSKKKFRRSVQDILQPEHDDHFLLRWLRARNWNAEAAEKMLRDSFMFRKQWELDSKVLTWEPPEVIKLYHPSGTSGFDKDGAPIIIIPFKGFDPIGFLNSCPKLDLIKMTGKILETNLKMAAETGEHQIVAIFDMEAFDIKQYASRPAPRVFAIAFNVVKRFLNGITLSKIQIFKSDPKKWKPAVLSNITPENLPAHYGGTLRDPDGNPRYTTVVRPGGKIPKSYYLRNIETPQIAKEFVQHVINKGQKLILDFMVVEDGCYLRWDFRTEEHDIRFGVTRKDENGVESAVARFKRVASHQVDESGVIACQAPATYIVTFDNSYSMFRYKKLHYRVFVTPPLETLDIIPDRMDLSHIKTSLEKDAYETKTSNPVALTENGVISESSRI